MNNRIIVLFSTAALLLLQVCATQTSFASDLKKRVRVKVMDIKPSTFSQKLILPASAKASKEVNISTEIAGRVVKIGFEKGDFINEGTPLLWLDDNAIKAELAGAMAQKELAELDYRKLKTLSERKANVSEFELEKARLNVTVATARIEGITDTRNKSVVKAPFSGRIVTRNIEVGAIVSPGFIVSRMVSTIPIKIRVGVPETALADFAIGKNGSLLFDAYPGKTQEGKITFISPEVNERDRTFDCELTLPNRNGAIYPEMSARVTFIRKKIENSTLIPQTAIIELADGHAVFVVEGEIARQKRIETSDNSEEMALVSSGLKAGERLVIVGQRGLLDGDLVKIED